jgi:ADP-ribose pyrophosphatase YjhB (NUDIX family)
VSGATAAVLAVVVRGPDVLLVRRRNPPNAGTWGFPGGRIEAGEAIAAATLRELREETGIEAEYLRVLNATDSITGDRAAGSFRHYVLVAGLCLWRSGEPVAGDDAADAGWFAIDRLPASPAPLIACVAEFALEARSLLRLHAAPA